MITKTLKRLHKTFCSNFNHIIDKEVAEELKKGSFWADYPGWNFFGSVFYDKKTKEYVCEVEKHRFFVGEIRSKTPEDLVEKVCKEHGYD